MIIAALFGGIGNQLFQYAAARALALRLGVPVGLDRRWFQKSNERDYALDRFTIVDAPIDPRLVPTRVGKLPSRLISRYLHGSLRIYREKGLAFHPGVLNQPDGTYLHGYFQCERYFIDQEAVLRRDLAFAASPDADNRAVLAEMGDSVAVSLHVRRGDYVSNPKLTKLFGTITLEYYERAAELIAERVGGEPRFFVFSNDPVWAEESLRLRFPMRIVSHNGGSRATEDLRLMAACRHHILANSSFSWWGAWLNPSPDKIVIAPQPWFRHKSLDSSTIIPERWLRLPA